MQLITPALHLSPPPFRPTLFLAPILLTYHTVSYSFRFLVFPLFEFFEMF